MITAKQRFCEQANQLVWQLINARLVERTAAKPKPSIIQLASELPFMREPYGRIALQIDGMRMRSNAGGRVPLCIGKTESVRSIIGSVVALHVIERILYGEVVFAGDQAAQAVKLRWETGGMSREVRLEFLVESGGPIKGGSSWRGFHAPLFVAAEWSPTAVILKA